MDRPELEKKLRKDAWEAPLSAELREKFYFAIEPLDFPEGTALAAKEPYSLRATSIQAYYRCQARARAAIEKAKTRASALAKLETAQAVAPLVRSAAVNAVGDGVMADTLASLAATAAMEPKSERNLKRGSSSAVVAATPSSSSTRRRRRRSVRPAAAASAE